MQVLLVDDEVALLLESGQGAADRLQLHSQVAADVGAAHPQVELAGRVAARLQLVGDGGGAVVVEVRKYTEA